MYQGFWMILDFVFSHYLVERIEIWLTFEAIMLFSHLLPYFRLALSVQASKVIELSLADLVQAVRTLCIFTELVIRENQLPLSHDRDVPTYPKGKFVIFCRRSRHVESQPPFPDFEYIYQYANYLYAKPLLPCARMEACSVYLVNKHSFQRRMYVSRLDVKSAGAEAACWNIYASSIGQSCILLEVERKFDSKVVLWGYCSGCWIRLTTKNWLWTVIVNTCTVNPVGRMSMDWV